MIHVIHDPEGDWQFLTNDEHSTDNSNIVALEQMILIANTLNEAFGLEYCEPAERNLLAIDGLGLSLSTTMEKRKAEAANIALATWRDDGKVLCLLFLTQLRSQPTNKDRQQNDNELLCL